MASITDYQNYAVQQANQYGVPPALFLWQIGQESGWNPNAQSQTSSAGGLGQFINSTAAQFGINKFDPYQSLQAAAQYDSMLYQQTGSWQGALTKYGTLANAPASVMQSFQNVMAGITNGNAGSAINPVSGGGQTTGQLVTSDSFITKIAMIVLGIVIIGGALLLYARNTGN